jgi:hypothetical protein
MKRRMALCVETVESRYLLSGLAYTLTTNQSTYQVGQPIVFTFTETNTGPSPVNVELGPVNSGFDVQQGGVTVWASNTGIQPQFLRLETLQPGQSQTLTATWDGVCNIGQATPLTGTFTATNQQAPTGASATFQIVNATLPPVQIPLPNNPALTATLTTGKPAYRPGAPVHIILTLTNTSQTAVELSPNPASDGFYASRGKVVVWRYTAAAGPDDARLIAPGQSVTFMATWNGRPNRHGVRSIRPGIYKLVANEGDYQISTTIDIGKHVSVNHTRNR